MAKARNPITFSEAFGVSPEALQQLGVLDPTLAIDTRLFIDPALLSVSSHAEMREAARIYREHFEQLIKLLVASEVRDDAAWKAADRLLTFPEIPGTCLGYGAGSIHGRSWGPKLRAQVLDVASQIVRIGVRDPDLFTALALFEEGVGPDRISDMVTNVVLEALGEFNLRVVYSLGLEPQDFEYRGVKASFLANPFENNRVPVILVPTDVLRVLPIASDWDSVASAAWHNEKLRDDVNLRIASIWEVKSKRDKEALKKQALSNKAAFDTLLNAIRSVDLKAYDSTSDPEGLFSWASRALEMVRSFPLGLKKGRLETIDEVMGIVREIVAQFRHLVEQNGLNKDLYHPDLKRPRHESSAQRLFFAVAYSYCKANDIDVSPEIDTGTGKVDFKFSKGFERRVLVEIKLSTNPNTVHGYTTQLEVYRVSQETTRAIYVVIDVGGMGEKDDELVAARNAAQAAGHPLSDLEFIDATVKPPASKR